MITLTDAEQRICGWVGRMRFQHARQHNRDPGAGPTATAVDARNDIRGAKCEFAASVLLNLYWRPTIGEIDKPDVGGVVEIRSTDRPNGRLIVKPKDSDEAPFALMIQIDEASFRFGGWMYGSRAKTYPLLTKHGDPAHFVPQFDLWKIDLLRDRVRYA